MKNARKYGLIVWMMGLSFVIGACNQSGKGSVDNADSANESKIDSNATSVNKDDASFMVEVANGGMTEVALSKLAEQSASSQRVKDFATMMVRDHTQANDRLKSIAGSKNVTLPDSLSDESKNTLEKLQNAKSSSFDKQYMKVMLDDHQKTVKKLQEGTQSIQDTQLKQWVSNVLPTVQMHLDSAVSINQLYGYKGSAEPYPPARP
jgi:putative membrane protein